MLRIASDEIVAPVMVFTSDGARSSSLLTAGFFKDKTPHLVLLVDDWLRLSTELDSFRQQGVTLSQRKEQLNDSILSKLPKDQE